MEDLPSGVNEFIQKYLSSVEQIAVLILLREDPARVWTIDDVARELRSSPVSIEHRLAGLERAGVLSPSEGGKVRYAPTSVEMSDAIARLIETYRSRPDRVIELIYTKAPDSLLAFADAFKLKKDKP